MTTLIYRTYDLLLLLLCSNRYMLKLKLSDRPVIHLYQMHVKYNIRES